MLGLEPPRHPPTLPNLASRSRAESALGGQRDQGLARRTPKMRLHESGLRQIKALPRWVEDT